METRRVFGWKQYRRWRKVALCILKDHVDGAVFAELRRNPPRYVSSDNLAWLDDTVAKVKGHRPDTKAILARGCESIMDFSGRIMAAGPSRWNRTTRTEIERALEVVAIALRWGQEVR